MSDAEQTESTDIEQTLDEAAEAVKVQTQALEELAGGSTAEPMGLGSLMSVPVRVTVELGRARMPLADLVELGPGSLIELDREAHEPADILVNGKVVAHGEVITIGESYGVRITDVLKS